MLAIVTFQTVQQLPAEIAVSFEEMLPSGIGDKSWTFEQTPKFNG
jgi:hypothetical protein